MQIRVLILLPILAILFVGTLPAQDSLESGSSLLSKVFNVDQSLSARLTTVVRANNDAVRTANLEILGDSATAILPVDFSAEHGGHSEGYAFQLLPDGLLFGSYLAGPLESRIGGTIRANTDGPDYLDGTLGGRSGILRWRSDNENGPVLWQLDVEGAAFPRLNVDEDGDVDSTDFRIGVPLTWRQGRWQKKFAFYHLSSHVGDEFIERNPGFMRINFSRDALVLGLGYFVTPDLRLYAEADYGFRTDGGAEPWWFQFGFDLAPSQPTGFHGAPFLAINAFLREEVNFGGTLTGMTGWAWRGDGTGHLLRAGLHYAVGHTSQLEFHQQSEQLIGLGLWYDF